MTETQLPRPRQIRWQDGAAALVGVGLVAGLIVAIAVATGAWGPLAPNDGGGGAPGVISDPDDRMVAQYHQTIANMAVAIRTHDWPMVARYRLALESQATPEFIQAIYGERARLQANLAAAKALGDARQFHRYRAELAALCPPVQIQASPAFCR